MDKKTKQPLKSYSKTIINYFSFGVESRIGLGFDKSRTKSRLCNMCVYTYEGIKKLLTSTKKANDILISMEILEEN